MIYIHYFLHTPLSYRLFLLGPKPGKSRRRQCDNLCARSPYWVDPPHSPTVDCIWDAGAIFWKEEKKYNAPTTTRPNIVSWHRIIGIA